MRLFLKNLIFTIFLPCTVAVYLPLLIVRGRETGGGPWLVPAAVLFLLGGAIYLWCIWDFATFGRGTPAPIDAPKHLVVRGLYRYTRNPMYLGVLAIVCGFAVLFRSGTVGVYGLVLAALFHGFVLLYEEPHLTDLFGDEYTEYQSSVNRWLPGRKKSSRSAL